MSFPLPGWYFSLTMTLFGLLFGSFANVVIWRVPRGESIARPGSHCPACDTPIAWYDNVPIVSWLVLRGRCRHCHEPIAVRYLLVEAVSGLLFGLAVLRFGATAQASVAAACFWLLLVLAAIDLDHMRLPNVLVALLAGIAALGAIASQMFDIALIPLTYAGASHPLALALIGAALGIGLSGGVAALYGAVRRRRGLGMGDIKLLGALGLLLGPYVLLALFAGSILGLVAGLVAARGSRPSETRIPFGPWLALGGILVTLVGPAVWSWYAHAVGIA